MGKYSEFLRIDKDKYPTPFSALQPLLPHLPPNSTYVEPCANDGQLMDLLRQFGHKCVYASDIDPQRQDVIQQDALTNYNFPEAAFIITNPPWKREILHKMIPHFCKQRKTFLLFDANWLHTRQSIEFQEYLAMIISVGRVKWFPDSKHTGKEDCAWFLFDKNFRRSRGDLTVFHGPVPKTELPLPPHYQLESKPSCQ